MSTRTSLTTIEWSGADSIEGCVRYLDQRELPLTIAYLEGKTQEDIHSAIYTMAVRGAPAIGVAGAFGMALAAFVHAKDATDSAQFVELMVKSKIYLDSARPTAVNLEWATKRIVELCQTFKDKFTPQQLAKVVLMEAKDLALQDVAINRRIGEFGNELVPKGANLIHHCNTGKLATVDYGTALGVIYVAHENDKGIHVWVDETRPRLQGAKLTTFELQQANIPFTLIPDGASSHLMYNNKVDMVVFGADRVAANGDVANKIGTCNLSICAHEYGIPTYACVPTSTIDIGIKTGREIEIELRPGTEITHINGVQITPNDCPTYNPSFDVTPAKYLTGIITEEGVCYPPFNVSLPKAKVAAEKRIREEWDQKLEKYAQLQ